VNARAAHTDHAGEAGQAASACRDSAARQRHGFDGTYDLPLTRMLASGLMLALADGPTGVHQTTVAKKVLRGYRPADRLWPSEYIPLSRAEAVAELLR
jgi:acyl-CoA dehydrogenase